MEWSSEVMIGLAAIALGVFYWSRSSFDFWHKLNVTGPPPVPLLGNLAPVLFGKTSFGELMAKIYNEYREEAAIGIYLRRTPALVLVDADLIKDVLIKDFGKFPDRGLQTFDKAEPLSQHLVNLEPARWRPLRSKLSPSFTSGKLKEMFYLLVECGQHLDQYLDKLIETNEPIECRELTAKFTTDVIGSCAFGIQMNALSDESSQFRDMGREIFRMDWKKVAKFRLREAAPWLYSLLGPIITDWKMNKFFLDIMRETMDYRKNNGIVKHDFIDLVMAIRDNPEKLADIQITDTLLTAQLFVFFLAGFETSSTTMSNALYELAQHPSVQDRLRTEIDDSLAKNNDKLDYDVIKSMKYLDMVFKETLRKYPPATTLMRKSVEDYTFSGGKLTLPKGTRVVVPVFAIHRDPRIYPKPEEFDPERFTERRMASRHPMNWLPFGDGPRNCIGARFANYQSKVGLVKIIRRYRVDVCSKTQIPYEINPKSFLLAPTNGIYVKMSKIL